MESNLPVKQNDSLFKKIKNFFRRIFFKAKIENNYEEKIDIQPQIEKKENVKQQFTSGIKTEVNNDIVTEIKREEFLDKIEKNPSLLYDLSVEKLEVLEKYYGESIKKQEEKLEKIRKAS